MRRCRRWTRCPVTEITFDPVAHAYTVEGRTVPSVTQCLGWLVDWSRIDADLLNYKAALGTAVHEVVHLECRGALDEDALDPELVPFLQQWRRFVAESGYTVLQSELRVSHPMGYAGTLDLVLGRVARTRLKRYVCDIKTAKAIPATVGPQVAAYAEAYKSAGGSYDGRKVLRLWPDGYKLDDLNDPADWSTFVSAKNLYHWRQNHGIV